MRATTSICSGLRQVVHVTVATRLLWEKRGELWPFVIHIYTFCILSFFKILIQRWALSSYFIKTFYWNMIFFILLYYCIFDKFITQLFILIHIPYRFCHRHGSQAQLNKPEVPPDLLSIADALMPRIFLRFIQHCREYRWAVTVYIKQKPEPCDRWLFTCIYYCLWIIVSKNQWSKKSPLWWHLSTLLVIGWVSWFISATVSEVRYLFSKPTLASVDYTRYVVIVSSESLERQLMAMDEAALFLDLLQDLSRLGAAMRHIMTKSLCNPKVSLSTAFCTFWCWYCLV